MYLHVPCILFGMKNFDWVVYSNNFCTDVLQFDFLGADKMEMIWKPVDKATVDNDQDDLETNQSATYQFIPCDSFIGLDEIFEEKKENSDKNFPSFDDDAPTTSTSPSPSNIRFKRSYSEPLFRFSDRKFLTKEKGDFESYHDIGKIFAAMMRQNIKTVQNALYVIRTLNS